MSTFDGWETRLYGDAMALPAGQLSDNELMHFRTKGSKNGVRRFQQPDGTWTPLGLKERKEREGWGDSRRERKAEKAVARSERRVAKAEKRSAKLNAKIEKKAAKKQAAFEKAEKKRLASDISKLTDEELQKKIARVKMEQEYKELTRSPILKTGEKLVSAVLQAKAKKEEREAAQARLELENKRINAEVIKAKESTKRASEERKKAVEERKKMEADVKGGKKIERETALKNAKIAWKGTTIHGGISRRINDMLTSGVKEKYKKRREFEGQVEANRILKQGQEAEAKRQADRAAEATRKANKAANKAARKHRRYMRKIDQRYGLSGNLN